MSYILYNIIKNILISTLSITYTVNYNNNINYIKDLENQNIEQLLEWLKLFFEALFNKEITNDEKVYIQDMYNIFVNIKSDYSQFINIDKYNKSLWFFTSLRTKDNNPVAKKILDNIKLFNERLNLFTNFHNIK